MGGGGGGGGVEASGGVGREALDVKNGRGITWSPGHLSISRQALNLFLD